MTISNRVSLNNYDLKPCPFCGNKAVIKSRPDAYGLRYYVMCGKCETKTYMFEKCEAAVELWNRRINND